MVYVWMTEFKGQWMENGKDSRPHVSLVMNFNPPTDGKPALLNHSELNTFLHEFGHALHGMLSKVTYRSLSGTSVYRDFVELPSQIMENFAVEKDFLNTFARHYITGEVMPESEIAYRQFVFWVRDSIIRERLADPAYGGDETYKIEEDKYGNPVTPHLNWSKPIPWRKPNEDELRAIESVYVTHPVTGVKMLDARQMNYKYEVYDHTAAALRKNRINPLERDLNTDHSLPEDQTVMISKDTAYLDDEGRIVQETITRPLSSAYDFLIK